MGNFLRSSHFESPVRQGISLAGVILTRWQSQSSTSLRSAPPLATILNCRAGHSEPNEAGKVCRDAAAVRGDGDSPNAFGAETRTRGRKPGRDWY